MMNRTNRFVPVLLAILYGTLALVSVPFHFHDDLRDATGSGVHAFAQHADASHCQHQSIVGHDDCTLCSAVSQHSSARPVTLIAPERPDPALLRPVSSQIDEQDHRTSPSLRGPPASMML